MEKTRGETWRTMSKREAHDLLMSIRTGEGEPTTDRTGKTNEPGCQKVQAAVLAFLYHALDPKAVDAPSPQGIWDMMPFLIMSLDEEQIKTLLEEILFTAQHPAVYSAIAPGIRLRVKAEDCEGAVLRHLVSENARERQNAKELAYYVFGWDQTYKMSDEGRLALEHE